MEFSSIFDEYSKYTEFQFLNGYLDYLYMKTGERFIFVIDEWDYLFNPNLFIVSERNDYLSYLKDLLKNKSYAALLGLYDWNITNSKRSYSIGFKFFLGNIQCYRINNIINILGLLKEK